METESEDLILKLLEDINKRLDAIPVEKKREQISCTFKEAQDFLYEYRWSLQKDTRNFVSRWNYISKYFGEKTDISELTNDDVLGFMTHLRKLKKTNKQGEVVQNGLTPKTINHYMSNLKTSIEFLEKNEKLKCVNDISFNGLNMPDEHQERVCFTKEEETTMLKYFASRYKETGIYFDLEMYHWFIINSNLGLRSAEFFALELGDIDFENSRVTISKAEHGSTKNNVIRTLPLSRTSMDSFFIILSHRLRLEGKISLNTLIDKTMLIEVASSSENKKIKVLSMSPEMLSSRWKRMRVEVGWTDKERYANYVPYSLRHTVASRLAGTRKFNVHQIKLYMGHKSIATSMYYIHLNTNDILDGAGIGVNIDDD